MNPISQTSSKRDAPDTEGAVVRISNWTAYTNDAGKKRHMDSGAKHYIDASARATRAENSARFSELEAKIETNVSRLEAKIDAIRPGATWQQIAGMLAAAVATAFGLMLTALSYGGDRFDSGASLMRLMEQRLSEQREIDAEQNARLNVIIDTLERQNAPANGTDP